MFGITVWHFGKSRWRDNYMLKDYQGMKLFGALLALGVFLVLQHVSAQTSMPPPGSPLYNDPATTRKVTPDMSDVAVECYKHRKSYSTQYGCMTHDDIPKKLEEQNPLPEQR